MKYTFSILTALMLLGCADAPQERSTQAESSSAAQKASTKTEAEPAGLQKTIAPPLIEHETTVQKVEAVKEEVVQKAEEAKTATVQAIEEAAVDGAVLFKKCASCHGQKAEKSALGKSQVIAGWDVSKIDKALHGYKDGSYGGAMKGLMKSQVQSLNDAQITALAEYINSL